jgi:hypothetical protein
MHRLCVRPGCSAPATVSLGFDSAHQLAWFEMLRPDSEASSGDLCARHANSMVLPRGWTLDDRRPEAQPVSGAVSPADDTILPVVRRPRARHGSGRRRAPRRPKWSEGAPTLFGETSDADSPPRASHAAAPEPAPANEGWLPRFDVDDDLDGLLDAKSPLLARAFRVSPRADSR